MIPAAPISCIPTIASVCPNSNVASNNSFSWKGSPTCTAGKSDEVALRLAQEVAQGNHDVLKVIASTAPFADVTTVAYAAGS